MRKLLILCSWVSNTGPIGVYFREQAKLISADFDITLIGITPLPIKTIGIRTIYRVLFKLRGFYKTEKVLTDEGVPLLTTTYPVFKFLPGCINKHFRKKTLENLNEQFHLSNSKNILVHAQSIFDAGFWAYSINKEYGTPYLITEHNQVFLKGVSSEKIERVQQVITKAKRMLVVSHDKARQLLMLRFKFQFNVIGNYVNENVFYPQQQKDISTFRIITIGSFTYLKDTQTIFKMIHLLDKKKHNKKIEFIYAGFNAWGGNYTDMVNKELENLTLKNIRVRLYPIVPRNEMPDLLREADLFVFSSISEGMPVSILEALATGIPVCTTQCGGVDEIITDINGKIIPLRDVAAMLDFTCKCIKEELCFDKTSIAKQVITEYGSKSFRQKLLNYYNI